MVDKFDKIDEFFRDSLKDHTYKEESFNQFWGKFQWKLFQNKYLRSNLLNGILVGLILTIGIFGLVDVSTNQASENTYKENIASLKNEVINNNAENSTSNIDDSEKNISSNTPLKEENTKSPQKISSINNSGINSSNVNDINSNNFSETNNNLTKNSNRNIKNQQSNTLNKSGENIENERSTNTNNSTITNFTNNVSIINEKTEYSSLDISKINSKEYGYDKKMNEYLPDLLYKDYSNNNFISFDYGKRTLLSYGIHFKPEMIFNTASNSDMSYNFDINANLHLNRHFFIQSGAGLSFNSVKENYYGNYERNEKVGTTYHVDSITYSTYPGTNIVYDKEYHISEIDSFNYVPYLVDEEGKSNYTYLNIPLAIGYKTNIYKRFSGIIKLGAVYSLLINKNEFDSKFYNDDIRILSLNNTPNRTNSSFQLTFSMGISYMLTDKISLSLEPGYKYYMNPVYEGQNSSYSFGLRTGLLFNF